MQSIQTAALYLCVYQHFVLYSKLSGGSVMEYKPLKFCVVAQHLIEYKIPKAVNIFQIPNDRLLSISSYQTNSE